ncbi:MAG: DUF485 domain-containing protein [Candidatus Aquicultorales bacterium]
MDIHSQEFLSMLMRRQLTLSMSLASVFVAIILGVPILNLYLPDVMNAPFLGFSFSWFFLGFMVFPVLCVLAWVFVKQSNAFEDEAVMLAEAKAAPAPTYVPSYDAKPAPASE